MSLAISAHQACAVNAQHHMEIIEGNILHQHIVATLQETGIDCKYRQQALLCHTTRHRNGVALGDTHIKKALGEGSGIVRKAGTVDHSGGDGADTLFLFCQFHHGLTEHIGKALFRLALGLACKHIKLAHTVELLRMCLSREIALPLLGMDMEQHRTALFLRPTEGVRQLLHIVTVHRAKIGKAHILEKRTAGQQGFLQRRLYIVAPKIELLTRCTAGQCVAIPLFQLIVSRARTQMGQMPAQCAHILADRHTVVVQNHDQRLTGASGIVHTLESKATGERGVAHQSQNAVILTLPATAQEGEG